MNFALVNLLSNKSSAFSKVEQNRYISFYDIAEELGIDHRTILTYLTKSEYTKKLHTWITHELTKRNLMNRVLICDSLLKRYEIEQVLKILINGDEKCITYDEPKKITAKRQESSSDHI
ncbi:Histone-lysine N-methyltransferase SETMAR [Eumeta japonica]|uniref:Histone-lysine N-methyltransferase SETMAR n=1 Tax=Eumeta variegata TaxID=151549 RepID=A0A4C1TCE3_EUMVA|nr:Histone-lysine N-methyltransferase SETMAR [Eumeta japonica]